ncbi:MAG TPA: metal-sensitive transcriptional regulator [Anaerolineales bacterium]|nr:metal-sensitive transcriptional regulator [Anaerolineales bacterium]
MKVRSPAVKEDLQKRLKRIEGQVRGVQKMVGEDRDCHEIIQQLAAIRSAVQGASLAFMKDYASDCVMNITVDDKSTREMLVNDLIGLLGKG